METFAGAGLVKDITCIGIPDQFLPFGSPTDIARSAGLDPDSVTSRVLALLS
jgi:deoxyxylulose-5-phosphate synthase